MAKKSVVEKVEEGLDPVKEVVSKALKADPALYAYADFEIEDVQFKEGDRFTAPLGWKRAPQMDELLSASKRKNGARAGISFSYLGKVVNPNAKVEERVRQSLTAILPLEER